MKRLILFLLIAVVGVTTVSISGSPRPAGAGAAAWPPLVGCPDLNGDGAVSGLDLFAMIGSAGSVYSPTSVTSDYLYLHDRNGDQAVNLSDFLNVLGRLGERCPLVDTQVALATMAAAKYQNCQDAVTDGYFQSTQFVPNMGIHLSKNENLTNWPDFYRADGADQLRHPVGLICTDSNSDPGIDVPHKLIGMWYVMPNMDVCFLYSNPPTCDNAEPEGFDGPEDNTDLTAIQKGWHTHPNLCIWGINTTQAGSQENVTPSACAQLPQPSLHFPLYGWMSHLYNFIPNEDGRFMMWSSLLPPEGG